MELIKEHTCETKKIINTMTCPREFSSRTFKLPKVTIWRGAQLIQCEQPERLDCPNGSKFCCDIVFCECPLLKYVFLQLGENPKKKNTE